MADGNILVTVVSGEIKPGSPTSLGWEVRIMDAASDECIVEAIHHAIRSLEVRKEGRT